MSDLIPWVRLEYLSDLCPHGKRVIAKLGGEGITLSQAHKACKNKVFNLPFAVRAATELNLPNWRLALGKMIACVHPQVKEYYKAYYEDESMYLHNQQCLEVGRLESIYDVVEVPAYAAGATVAADAAQKADAYWVATRYNDAAYDAWVAATEAVGVAASSNKVEVLKLIDIYFDVLEEA